MDTRKDYRPPTGHWPAPRLRALQVEEAFGHSAAVAGYGFVASLIVFGVLEALGDGRRAVVWLIGAALVALLRGVTLLFYRRRDDDADPGNWARFIVAANVLAGAQWGILGTLLFPEGPVHAQLFVATMIVCLVAGAMTAHAAVAGAHEVLTLTAVVPTMLYLFFIRQGVQAFEGAAALLLCAMLLVHARQMHTRLTRDFETRIERDDLLAVSGAVHDKISSEKRVLEHRAAVRGASAASARERAERLEALFVGSPLPHLQVDSHGLVLRANEAAERLFGVGHDALEGLSAPMLLPGLDLRQSPATVAVSGDTPAGRLHASAHVAAWSTPGGSAGYGVTLSGVEVASLSSC